LWWHPLSGGAEDRIHLPILDEEAVGLDVSWGLPLYLSLRRQCQVEDELSKISLINQVLEVSLEGFDTRRWGSPYHRVRHNTPRSWSFQILLERSCGTPNPGLVFDGINHVADRNPEWD